METGRFKPFVLLLALAAWGDAYACQERPIPVHFLNTEKGAYHVGIPEFAEVAGTADGVVKYFIVNKNRNYFEQVFKNGQVLELHVKDRCLKTDRGIRVGDSFSKVMSAYPDAKFIMGGELPVVDDTGHVNLSLHDGGIKFLIRPTIPVPDFVDVRTILAGDDPIARDLAESSKVYLIVMTNTDEGHK